MLRGRREEIGTIDGALAAAKGGESAVLVIRGAAGIGKSALLDYAQGGAAGMRVWRTAAVETENELPYAGLQALLSSGGDGVPSLSSLPDAQARALGSALGLKESSPTPDAAARAFLVGLGALTLLSEAAGDEPLLCLVDDAQWLDSASASALLIAARRLSVERVALVLAIREPHAPILPTPGLPELRLTGLDPVSAEAVLDVVDGRLSNVVRARLIDEAQGNPLALRVLAGDTPGGGSGAATRGVDDRILATFARRIQELPARTRSFLTAVAVEETGRRATVLAAGKHLGLDITDLRAAEARDLVRARDEVITFGHPLIRAAARDTATLGERIDAHRAVAASLPTADRDRHAWHLAAATTGDDEDVAALMEECAERARDSGGLSAVAAAYLRAAELSPKETDRVRRTVAAARAETDAGRLDRGSDLLDSLGVVEDSHIAVEVAWIGGLLNNGLGRPGVAADLLLDAVETAPTSVRAELLRFALRMVWADSDFERVRLIGTKAVGLPEEDQLCWLVDAVLAVSRVEEARIPEMGAEVVAHLANARDPRDRLLLARLYLALGEFTAARRIAQRLERECRDLGAIAVLPDVLVVLARCDFAQGRLTDVQALAHEGIVLADESCQWQARLEHCAILAELAAMEGDEERCERLAARVLEVDVVPSHGQSVGALTLLDLGLGRYAAALDRMEQLLTASARGGGALGSVPLMVEAAVRLGEPHRGIGPATLLDPWLHSPGHGLHALALRCGALLGEDEELYRAAQAADTGGFTWAHTTLLYGEWLRRCRRHAEARTQLRSALEEFDRTGMTPWAARARRELRASGETRGVDATAPDPTERLTPQELQVVRLAAGGLTNREIGAQLFLSPRTVGHHLYRAYPKLGVTSRRQLAHQGIAPPESPSPG